mgnify:CR=1 FL=1
MFIDADVQIRKELIGSAISYFESKQLKLLSLFPDQILKSSGEKITVPIMHWILLTLLPLFLIRKSRLAAFSAANGQFMLFEAHNYTRHQYHKLVKSHPVEDIKIMKIMKRKGFLTATLLGNGLIFCRMYHGHEEALRGFSKNIIDFFGGSIIILMLYNIITTFSLFIMAIGWNVYYAVAYLILLLYMKVLVSKLSRQSIVENLLFMLPLHCSQVTISFLAIRSRIRGIFHWKGREIRI